MVEDHAPHASTVENREAVYRCFQEHLSLPGDPSDEPVELLEPEELNVTETGQVSTSLGGESIFSINAEESEILVDRITTSRRNHLYHLESVREQSRELSGYCAPEEETEIIYRGSYRREGYSIGMYAIGGEGGYIVPLLLAVPEGEGPHPAVVYIHPGGKEAGIARGGVIEKLVHSGYMVAAPDLLGTGETQVSSGFLTADAFLAILTGRSIPGIQAGDIVRVVHFLKDLPGIDGQSVRAIAVGEQCPALLHAAAYEPSISGVALVEGPVSYFDITRTRLYEYSQSFYWGVAGALTAYDLPDLAACIAPRKLACIGMLNARKEPAIMEFIEDQMAFPISVYAASKPDHLLLLSDPSEEVDRVLVNWLKE